MSVKLNIGANYAGQLYSGLIGLAMVPVFLRIMHPETFALIGFFTMVQAWSQLLDLGMSATMSRETARYFGGGISATQMRQLLRSLEWVFWPVGMLLALAIALASPAIVSNWLKVQALQRSDVEFALVLMGVAVGLRWIAGLYRGVISGAERQVWLNSFNALVSTARFLGVIPVLLLADAGAVTFFIFQALVSVAELWIVAVAVRSLLPAAADLTVKASFASLRPVLNFSAGIAVATILWVFATQADKLIMSARLPLAEYGFFTAAVMAASAITMLSAAVAQALLPHMTRLSVSGDEVALLRLYRNSSQLTAAVAGPLALVLSVLAQPVLWAWTGDRELAASYAPVLALYAVGNAFMTLAAFPYYLQYAKGNLRLHLWGTLAFSIALVPAVYFASITFGAVGTGAVWTLSNAAFFFLWAPFVHARFVPGLHRTWLFRDIVSVLALPCLIGLLTALTGPWIVTRLEAGVLICTISLAMFAGAFVMSDLARPRLRLLYSRLAPRLP